MKVNLHNKLEIKQGSESVVCYNTMLSSAFVAITELRDYSKYLAVGTGMSESDFNKTTLDVYTRTFSLETEDISCDITSEEIYIKKVVTLGEDDYVGLSFCEVGITDSDAENPTIYNRVLIRDNNGNASTITKRKGEVLTIKLTIYLEIEEDSKKYFTLGNNKLIMQMLGEHATDDKQIYAVRGIDESEGESISRAVPKGKSVKCSLTSNDDYSNFTFDISASLGSGEAREVAFAFADECVARYSLKSNASIVQESKTFLTTSDGYFDIGRHFDKFVSLKNNDTDEIVTNVEYTRIAERLGEGVSKLANFDKSSKPTVSSTIEVSPSGEYFAVGIGETNRFNHVFKATCEGISEVVPYGEHSDASQICRLLDGAIYCYDSVSREFFGYDYEKTKYNTVFVDTLSLSNVYEFATITDFECMINADGHLLLGILLSLDSGSKIGVVASFERNEMGTWSFRQARETSINGVAKVVAYHKEFGGEGQFIFFANDNTTSENVYAVEIVSENSSRLLSDAKLCEYAFRDDVLKIEAVKDLICFKLGSETFNSMPVYDLTNEKWTSYVTNSKVGHTYDISKNGKYFAEKTYAGAYTRLLRRKFDSDFKEFENGFEVKIEEVQNVILTKDLIVYLKNMNGTYVFEAYRYDECETVGKVVDKNATLTGVVDYRKYLGTDELEGVEVKFSLRLAPPSVSEE